MSQPAIPTYFFGPGYDDLKAVISETWTSCRQTGDDLWKKANSAWPVPFNVSDISCHVDAVQAAGYGAAACGYFIMLGLCVGILATLHSIILGVGSAALFFVAAIIRGTDGVWRVTWRIGHPCPNPECYRKDKRPPVYICPSCGEEHTRLLPGRYGVLRRFCKCGANLPVIHILGRRALECRCPHCSRPLINVQTSDLHVAYVGGPSSGKSSLFFAQFREMTRRYTQAGYDRFEYADPAQKAWCDSQIENLSLGRPVAKTTDIAPKAIHLILHPARSPVGKSLYIYDVAGEAFNAEESVGEHSFYDHIDGIVFVVDPFSIPSVWDEYMEVEPNLSEVARPCPLLPEEAYTRMLTTLRGFSHRGDAAIRHARLAVVISKIDMFDLRYQLDASKSDQGPEVDAGLPAVEQLAGKVLTASPKPGVSNRKQDRETQRVVTCREWLEHHGQGNLIRLMEDDFKHVRFFSASALGRDPRQTGQGSFEGIRVLNPLLWSVQHRLPWKASIDDL